MIPAAKLLKQLILIPSPSGEEKAIGEFVFDLLKNLGFNAVKDEVDKNGFNVIATVGSPKIYFSTHLDTVNKPLPFAETETHIFGRGACDAKNCVATMICAAVEAKDEGVNNFGLIFTVGEETDFRGAKKIISSKRRTKIPFVVVGEPTSLEIVNGHFGVLEIKLTALGKSAHSSEPEKGVNAIDKLIEAINRIKKIKLYQESSVNLGVINGGNAANIVPDKAEARLSFRISPNDENDYFKEARKTAGSLVKVEKMFGIGSVYTKVPPQFSFIKKRKTVKYCTELSLYRNGLVLGPGDIKYAHGDREMIEKSKLKKAIEIYKKILRSH